MGSYLATFPLSTGRGETAVRIAAIIRNDGGPLRAPALPWS